MSLGALLERCGSERAVSEKKPLALAFGEQLGRNEDAAPEDELNGVREHVGVEGFRHEARCAELQYAHDAAAVGEARKDEDLEHGLAADDFLHQLRAFDAGQVQVENEQVGGLAFTPDELKGCGHVAGRQHFGRGIPVEKHHGKGAPHERVIIDNQVLHAIEALREQSVSTFSTGLDCTKEEVRRTSPKT